MFRTEFRKQRQSEVKNRERWKNRIKKFNKIGQEGSRCMRRGTNLRKDSIVNRSSDIVTADTTGLRLAQPGERESVFFSIIKERMAVEGAGRLVDGGRSVGRKNKEGI
jgi:hypothetical protein